MLSTLSLIFSHANVSSTMQSKIFTPTITDCYKYLDHMKLPLDVIQSIEAAISEQSALELCIRCRMED